VFGRFGPGLRRASFSATPPRAAQLGRKFGRPGRLEMGRVALEPSSIEMPDTADDESRPAGMRRIAASRACISARISRMAAAE
jgi:hypothetical protein